MTTELPGTSNVDSLNLQGNLVVAGTMSVAGAATLAGTQTYNGPVIMNGPITMNGTLTHFGGMISPGSLFIGAGTVKFQSGFVGFNAAVAGFAVQLPAPVAGADYDIVNQVAPSGGNNTIVIPAGGTIYQGTLSGSVLTFSTVGQTARVIGISPTQYRSMQPGTTSPTLS